MLTVAAQPTPVTPDTAWTAWNLDPVVLAVVFVALWTHRRGRVVAADGAGHRRRARAFAAAMVALVVALVSPLDALAEVLLSAHMAQHVLLVLVAAPLLAMAAPSGPVLRGMPPPVRRSVLGLRRRVRPGARRLLTLGGPVLVWLLHVLTVWTWHAAVVYEAAVAFPWLHVVEHATFLATAVAFWWVVLGSRAGRSRVPHGLGVLLVFGMAMQGVMLSALLTFSVAPWYPTYVGADTWGLGALADQHLAGLVLWIPGSIVYLAVALALLAGWLRGLERDVEPA